MARKAANRFWPCLRTVARMLERMADASAPQAERKLPMTLRWMTEGRRSRSELLLVGSTSSRWMSLGYLSPTPALTDDVLDAAPGRDA
jgi:hypothetical protein